MTASTRHDRTADLVARDLAHLWHPFTQHSVWPGDEPLVIERATGMYLYDSEGRRYLDGVSSLWVTVHGHREPRIDQAIRDQLDRLDHSTFLGLTHEPGIVLAERLLGTAPGASDAREPAGSATSGRHPARGRRNDRKHALNRVFYAGDGASAVEAALKMAYQAAAQRGERRPLYLHVAEGYHGDTLGAVSVGGIDTFHATYRPILLETRQVSSPGVLRAGQTRVERAFETLAELRDMLDRDGEQVCAIIVEPLVQAAAGMLTHDGAFLRGARALADEYGALLIADEVATGIGRTGKMWAVEHVDVRPDLLACGKGLSGGYLPISAVLASEAVYEDFLGTPASARTFFHGHTYTANPLSCAAAVANLDLMAERGTVEHAAKAGTRLGELLTPLDSHDGVIEVRRLGAMVGIEVRPRGERTAFRVCQAARRRGVWVRPLGDVVICMPPPAIEEPQIEELCTAIVESVHEVVG